MSTPKNLYVLKRDGRREPISFDKILRRITLLCDGLDVEPSVITQQVVSQIYPGVKTTELDDFAAQVCAHMQTEHLDYGKLAARIMISDNHKQTHAKFSEAMRAAWEHKESDGTPNPLISEDVWKMIVKDTERIDSAIHNHADNQYDYFGFQTLKRSYLLKAGNKIIERPQYMLMRVSLGLYPGDLEHALESYEELSQLHFTHATPTLFHAGTRHPQLISCFLLGTEDSIDGIYKTISDCAKISKWAGGLGVHVSEIRSKGTIIRGTQGRADGIVPMLRVYNNTARYVNQGGRRNGSIAIYLEPHHPDILDFLELRKNHGAEEERCRDLFSAIWVSDTFLERVDYALKNPNEKVWWPLIDPTQVFNMQDLYGEAYAAKIDECLETGTYMRKEDITVIWKKILAAQIETGTPYITNKDAVNRKNNQANLGTIRSSNLCNEIVEYSDANEYACCCLVSLNLPRFWNPDGEYKYGPRSIGSGAMDWEALLRTCEVAIRNLNQVVDLNFYPIPETKRSNYRHRPLGVGIQGVADLFALARIPWEDPLAQEWNAFLMETIQFGCWSASMKLARERAEFSQTMEFLDWASEYRVRKENDVDLCVYNYPGSSATCRQWTVHEIDRVLNRKGYPGAYVSFAGSPASNGKFQHDMWNVNPLHTTGMPSGVWDWDGLRGQVMTWGTRNSLCTALMPTASTSQIMGNQECFEPFSSLLYVRRTLAGDFVILNQYLVRDLMNLGLWNVELKDEIVSANGSIQGIDSIPEDLRRLYKTVHDLKQRVLIDCAAARGPFVDQTQSMNLYFTDPTPPVVSAALLYGWRKGLKTLLYYLRSRPSVQAQQVTIDPRKAAGKKPSRFQEAIRAQQQHAQSSSSNTPDCEFCSS